MNFISYWCPVAPSPSFGLKRVVELHWIWIGTCFGTSLNCSSYGSELYFFLYWIIFLLVPNSSQSFYWIGTCCGTVLSCISYRCNKLFWAFIGLSELESTQSFLEFISLTVKSGETVESWLDNLLHAELWGTIHFSCANFKRSSPHGLHFESDYQEGKSSLAL